VAEGSSEIIASLDLDLRKPKVQLTGDSIGAQLNGILLNLEKILVSSEGSSWLHSDLVFQLRKLKLTMEGDVSPVGALSFTLLPIVLEGRAFNSSDGAETCSYDDLEFER
jgi:hypothetical protein